MNQYFNCCKLKYLQKIHHRYLVQFIPKFYYDCMQEQILPEIYCIILMLLPDPWVEKIWEYHGFISRTFDHWSTLRVCLRVSKEEKWRAKFMYRIFVQRCIEQLYDLEEDSRRMESFAKVIHYIRDPNIRCITFDLNDVVLDNIKISFEAYEDYDFTNIIDWR